MAHLLKQNLATGGTVKDGVIELQGDHRQRLKPLLLKLGFPEESIEILD
jgi:translation initiation factor 1